jgi:hypothetical protein
MKRDKSIYTQQCPELVKIFNDAPSEKKVLCIPLDYAKKTHTACCVDGLGNILKNSFTLQNNPNGVEYLKQVIDNMCHKHGFQPHHVILGGEDCGHYAANFIYALVSEGYPVFRVNAYKAKQPRENTKASTDTLDLRAIAGVFLRRQGYIVEYPDTEHMQCLCRHRNDMVTACTMFGNRIHHLVDQVFPGFLDSNKSGIPAFSDASLLLMSDKFSPQQIKRRRVKTLAEQLKKCGVQKPLVSAGALRDYAGTVLPPNPTRLESLQTLLADQCSLFKNLKETIHSTDKGIGMALAGSSGAFATTMAGTGVVLAALLTSELGNSVFRYKTSQMVSYAGLVPYLEQTGGPDKPGVMYGCPRNYNHMLKNALMQLAMHIGKHGPSELKTDYHRRKDAGQNADFGMARRYVRIYLALTRRQEVYLPNWLRTANTPPAALASCYVETWPKLRRKWERLGLVEKAFSKENPLGVWRECVQDLYKISLPLVGSKTENNFSEE